MAAEREIVVYNYFVTFDANLHRYCKQHIALQSIL